MNGPAKSLTIRFLTLACIAILLIVSSVAAADTTDQARQLYQKGETALYAGQYQQAIVAFDQCLAVIPSATSLAPYKDFTEADVWTNKGDAYIGLKQYEDAVASLEKATRLDPSYAEAFQLKAKALRALNRTAEADAAETGMEQAAQKGLDDFDKAAFVKPTTKADLPGIVPVLGIIGGILLCFSCRKIG
ncbi:MAG: tetratricopeptide repeat protein [Methanoregula sp.]|nr:tetratricopeptide repeat protein [Methanoregula sp.]